MKTEEKLAIAVKLIKEAGLQYEKAGLELNFKITIKALPSLLYCMTESGENDPPSHTLI